MNQTLVSIFAAAMLVAFGYTVDSAKAAASSDSRSDNAAVSDMDPSRADKMNQGAVNQGRTGAAEGPTGTATADPARPLTSTSMDKGWAQQHLVDKMVGKSVVNVNGDSLGTVKDFVIDDQGRISFAVVSHGGFLGMGATDVLVPYEALSFDGKGNFALNMNKDQLAAAPRFDNQNFTYFSDRNWTDQVYRYYGVQPRWSDSGMSDRSGAGFQRNESFGSQGPSETGQPSRPDNSGMGTPGSGSTGMSGSGSRY